MAAPKIYLILNGTPIITSFPCNYEKLSARARQLCSQTAQMSAGKRKFDPITPEARAKHRAKLNANNAITPAFYTTKYGQELRLEGMLFSDGLKISRDAVKAGRDPTWQVVNACSKAVSRKATTHTGHSTSARASDLTLNKISGLVRGVGTDAKGVKTKVFPPTVFLAGVKTRC